VTCHANNQKHAWKKLEAALIDTFRRRYFQLPKYNKVRPKHVEGLFNPNALQKLIEQFEQYQRQRKPGHQRAARRFPQDI
jgi:hypothetical protein